MGFEVEWVEEELVVWGWVGCGRMFLSWMNEKPI